MRRAGLDLEPVDIAALHARTGGWPAGLKFAAMALAGRADPHRAAQEFRGDTGNVAAFLMSEVLAKQPPETRELLLRTCLVDELDPGLVTALTGRHCDPRTLQFMAHGNSFIEQVPGRPGHYRYQSLFREFLRSQVEYEWPGLVPELHRTAAEWLARDGRLLVAIRPAASAQAWPIATRCFVEGFGVGRLLIGPRRAVLHDLLGGLPDDAEGADAAVTRAALAVADVDLDLAEAALVEVRSLPSREESPRSPALALTVLVLEAVAGSMDPDLDAGLDAVLRAENALSLVPADDRVARPELEIVLAGCRGRVLLQRGDLGAALAALTRGVRLAEAARLEEAAAQLQGMAALAEAMTGRLRKAAEIAAEWGAQDDTGSGPSYSSRAAVLALAWARMDQYDLGAVQDLLALSEPAACSPYDARLLGALGTLLRARLLRAQGRPELARAGIRAVSAPDRSTPVSGRLARSLVLEEAACLVQEHRPQEAVETLRTTEAADAVEAELLLEPATLAAGPVPEQTRRPAGALAGSRWRPRSPGGCADLPAAARRPDGPAEAFLARALRPRRPNGSGPPFLEAPRRSPELLGHAPRRTRHGWLRTTEPASTADEHALVGAQRSPVTGGAGRGPRRRVPPLTAKEQEVLGYLAQLLTTDEIAATMFVSGEHGPQPRPQHLRKLGDPAQPGGTTGVGAAAPPPAGRRLKVWPQREGRDHPDRMMRVRPGRRSVGSTGRSGRSAR
jgi:LuxR family maltose regulon positive regulatory protein